jgi:hypothetical protein
LKHDFPSSKQARIDRIPARAHQDETQRGRKFESPNLPMLGRGWIVKDHDPIRHDPEQERDDGWVDDGREQTTHDQHAAGEQRDAQQWPSGAAHIRAQNSRYGRRDELAPERQPESQQSNSRRSRRKARRKASQSRHCMREGPVEVLKIEPLPDEWIHQLYGNAPGGAGAYDDRLIQRFTFRVMQGVRLLLIRRWVENASSYKWIMPR